MKRSAWKRRIHTPRPCPFCGLTWTRKNHEERCFDRWADQNRSWGFRVSGRNLGWVFLALFGAAAVHFILYSGPRT